MRKLKLFLSMLMVMLLSVGNVWAAEELKATIDFSSNDFSIPTSKTVAENTYTHDGISMTLTGTSGNGYAYYSKDKYLLNGKQGATITFSAFEWKTTKIVVTGRSGASGSTKMNIFVGENAVSTETTGCTGTNTYNIASTSQAAGTIYTLKVTSAHNAQFTKFEIYGEDAGAPAKTLTSIAVSGAPTKTAYYVGDEFDPAGLVVTGTYSDDSQAAITSGITWAYDPSQELALNQTSIGVTATVNEISSPKFNVTGLSVTAPVVSNWQVTAPADLETGDVVVLTMLKNNVYYAAPNNGTSAPAATVVAVANSKLSNSPAETLQWTVTVVEEGVYQFSKGTNYLKCTDTNNGVRVGAVGTDEYNTFDINTTNAKQYLHTTATMTSATNGRFLGIYNTQDWRCYTSVNNNIKDGSLVIFREPASSKENAGLAYAAADAQKLVKVGGSLVAPTLSNENNLTVTYASSDANVVAVSSDGATLTIKAAGKAVITASSEETTVYKAGSASYTIFVAEQAGTAEDPLTEASAKDLIDLGCTMSAHVTGTIQGKTYYSNSGSYNVTLTNGFLFYYFYAAANSTPFESDILTNGDELVGYGQLMKYGNNYEINPSYMVSRVPYSEPLVDISNTLETAYTPAYAIQLYNNPTSDLTKEVYVKGLVVATPALKYNDGLTGDAAVYNGTYNVYVKAEDDLSENPTKFEFFRMYADDNNTTFEDGDIQVGEVIIAKGILSKYNSTYEFAQGCQMVSKKSKATMTFDNLEMVVNDEKALAPKTITLATAEAVTYAIKEGSDDCITLANGVVTATAEGTATIVATVATDEAYIGTSVEFTVTVSAAAPVLTDYYEKVTETENITDGTYLIVYENGNVAFNGGLETLDAESNTIAVAITNDNKIGVTEATAAATFFIDVTAGSIQAANGKYIGVSSNSNGLKTSDDASTYTNAFAIDNDGNAVISAVFSGSTMTMRYNSASNQARFRYYKDNGQQAIQLYKLANETVKANPELAWSEDVEITLGDDFTAPTMSHADGFTGTITYSSDNEELATVNENGVISLVADATGTAHITASFAGNDDYKAMSATCTITVNAAPTPAETKNVVILAEYNSKFYAMTTTLNNKAFKAVEVEKDGDKIVVFAEADKSAIQWTMTANTTTATFQDADDKYLAHTGTGTDLTLQADAEDWTWDSENGYYYAVANRTFFYNNSGVFKNYSTSNLPADKTDYSGAPEIIEIAAEDIILSQKEDPQLAYTPAEVTLTVGGEFTPAVLSYAEGFDGLEEVTYESSNENVATVNESGVVSLVADATGTATITATFAGNNNYLAGSASYVITVNEAGDDLTGTWVLANSIAAGDKFIVAGTYNNETKTMGKQNSNPNRAAVASSVDEWNVLTPGEGTKVFTLVDAGENKFAIQASNGKYLSATGTGTKNYLAEADDFEADNAKWTISIENGVASVVASSSNRNNMQYNKSGDGLFSCYDGNQTAIQIFKIGTPDYGSYQRNVTNGNYGTICLPQAGMITGATLFEIAYYDETAKMIYLDEVTDGAMVASRPYIFQATASQLNVTYTSGDVVATAGNYHGLYGFYDLNDENATTGNLTQDAGNYILYQNAYWLVKDRDAYVANYRAYIKLGVEGGAPTSAQAQAPGRRRVAMAVYGEQTATGVDAINAAEAPVKMMINGQMYILRGEKMYDATGRLVK